MNISRLFLQFTLSISVLLFSTWNCHAQTPESADPLYFPAGTEWQTVSSEQAHASAEKLQQALDFAEKANSGGVVVLWRGKILAEQYWRGWDKSTSHPLYSATKSITSALVGIAIEEGQIKSVEQSASDFLTEWQAKPEYEAIQIQHLLSMTGGLQGGRRNFMLGIASADERQFAISLPQDYEPGTQWDYHNSAYHLLFPILEAATGKSLAEYTTEKITGPLGMEQASWFKKRRGENQYGHMLMTCRDAARFGLMVLADGRWQDQQIVPSSWLGQATTPWNKTVNPAYGYLWWLNGGDSFYLPLRPIRLSGPIFPGCPEDAFAALGKDDQKIYIVPSLDLVVVRLGESAKAFAPALSSFDAEFLGLVCSSFENGK